MAVSSPEATMRWEDYKQSSSSDGFKGDCEYLEKKRGTSFTYTEQNYLDQWTPELRSTDDSSLDVDWSATDLLFKAQLGRIHAYCPYSHFPVGAAILTKSGRVFIGCNVENAAYGSTICAERTAFVKAMSEINEGRSCEDRDEEPEFIACAIVLRTGGSPCGACRQVLNEGNSNMRIIMGDIDGTYKETTLKEYLPDSFGPKNLK